MKAIITNVGDGAQSSNDLPFSVSFIDTTTSPDSIILQWGDVLLLETDLTAYSIPEFTSVLITKVMDKATEEEFDMTEDDIIFLGTNMQADWTQTDAAQPDFIRNKPSLSFSTQTRSIVTDANAANGWQPSATRPSFVDYSVTIATTATIGGSADGHVLLELAATNSSSSGDWSEIGRFRNGQAITLALALQSVQTMSGQLSGMIPIGYYVRLRSVNNAGTPTYTYITGREVLL